MLDFKNYRKFLRLAKGLRNEDYERNMPMKIDAVKLIYFSPTRTTKTTLMAIAEGLGADSTEHIDLTSVEVESREIGKVRDELVVIGTPVYGGRVPLSAVKRLQRLKGGSGPAVIVVVYGNRAYEDALLELKTIVTEAGFTPVAAAAFVGEHSLASESTPIAGGRPDTQDLFKAKEFGMAVRENMERMRVLPVLYALKTPGNFPYKERSKPSGATPVTRAGVCVACGKCLALCPTGAITMEENGAVSDGTKCILCCACVKDCMEKARVVEDPGARDRAEKLRISCRERKEPEIYL
jgi:ferredoxin